MVEILTDAFIKFTDFSDDMDALVCPVCHGDMVSLVKVEVFGREDGAPTGLHTTVHIREPLISGDMDMKGNPSADRGGINILLSCEECGDLLMELVSHKGQTVGTINLQL